MGCTSAKQLSSVPSDEEGRGKAYSNGDAFSGQCPSCVFTYRHVMMIYNLITETELNLI